MLCSIVIPLYNKAVYIEATLQSILNQSYQNFEIIVVDDGSKDDSAARISVIQDNRIHLFQQPNSGVSSARNKGIELAKGELVCFLDADDWYLPTYLETIVSMAKKYPDAAYFATGYQRVSTLQADEKKWDVGNSDEYQIVENFYDLWCRSGAFFFTGSVAVRRQILNLLQPCFPVGESMGEDHDLWFKLGGEYSLVFCPASLVGYRVDVEGSLCANNKVLTLLPSYVRLEQRALNHEISGKLRSSALRLVAETRVTIARSQLVSGNRLAALKQLLDAWRGLNSKRWWISLLMCMIGSPSAVRLWENWRRQRVQTR